MGPTGIAVIGVAGGCGVTTLTCALASTAPRPDLRVLCVDGHGGGPHVAWGLRCERTVDDLLAVRSEVDAAHVAHITHRQADGREVVVGPRDAAAVAEWAGDTATRLAAALVTQGDWLADLGRGDNGLAQAVIARATGLVVVVPRTVDGASATQRALSASHASRVAVAVAERPGDGGLSMRAFRRLVGTDAVVPVPWAARAGRRRDRGAVAAATEVREVLNAAR